MRLKGGVWPHRPPPVALPCRVRRSKYQIQPQQADLAGPVETFSLLLRLDENSSIFAAAPFRTRLPISIASAISPASAPNSWALSVWYCRQGWQLAVIDAPTATSSLILLSIAMRHHLPVFTLQTKPIRERIQVRIDRGRVSVHSPVRHVHRGTTCSGCSGPPSVWLWPGEAGS